MLKMLDWCHHILRKNANNTSFWHRQGQTVCPILMMALRDYAFSEYLSALIFPLSTKYTHIITQIPQIITKYTYITQLSVSLPINLSLLYIYYRQLSLKYLCCHLLNLTSRTGDHYIDAYMTPLHIWELIHRIERIFLVCQLTVVMMGILVICKKND